MGVKLESYFEKAKADGGLSAQMKLAMLTKMSPAKAKDAPDDEANIKIFEDAMKKIS
ncbi:MAG: hypothetical protein JXX29_22050 [Deltaproteobacteria bacterium]|nr:hypothetical protein [Deltaproteobacteria bacterium]MBN2674379.1 hypothetical protein [Deltaproteobacteria bacterium]